MLQNKAFRRWPRAFPLTTCANCVGALLQWEDLSVSALRPTQRLRWLGPCHRRREPKVEKRMVALGPRLWRLIDGLEGRGSVDVPLTAPRPAFDLIAELGVGSYVDPQSGREGWVEVCVRLGFIDRPGSSGFLVSRRPEHPKPLLARGYCICLSLLHSIWFWWSPPFLAFEIGPSWDASEDLTLIFVSSSSLLWLATIVGLGVCWVGEDFRRAGGEC
ncbi:hypothetical protein U1Q18_004912 [Sarracenia purpurea var. burkii]